MILKTMTKTIFIFEQYLSGKWSYMGDRMDHFLGSFLHYKGGRCVKKKRHPGMPFSACGKCWQETGVIGSYEEKDAQKMLAALLNCDSLDLPVRYCKMEVAIKITPVATIEKEGATKDDKDKEDAESKKKFAEM